MNNGGGVTIPLYDYVLQLFLLRLPLRLRLATSTFSPTFDFNADELMSSSFAYCGGYGIILGSEIEQHTEGSNPLM
jgi:hypothetical protein